MKKLSLGLLILTILFSFGCAGVTEHLIQRHDIKTNFEQTRTSLPERHLKFQTI